MPAPRRIDVMSATLQCAYCDVTEKSDRFDDLLQLLDRIETRPR